MSKYQKAFTPKRANTASAALYTFLSDGQPHQVEDALTVVVDALKQEQASAAGDNDAMVEQQQRRQLRSAARNAVYVARRSGRVQQQEGRLTLDASIAASWNGYRAGDADGASSPVADSSPKSATPAASL